VEFRAGLDDAKAARLGLQADRVSVWQIGLRLTAEQACMAPAALAASVRTTLLGLLSESGAASPVADVGIASSSVAPGGVACGRRAASLPAAAGGFEKVIAFQAGVEPPLLSAARLRLVSGILSFAAVSVRRSPPPSESTTRPPPRRHPPPCPPHPPPAAAAAARQPSPGPRRRPSAWRLPVAAQCCCGAAW